MSSKQTKSDKYFVRADGTQEFLKTKTTELSQALDTKRILAMYHLGDKSDNPHCHFVIQIANEIQLQSFRTRMKNVFQVEKKSQFSVKIWDGKDSACSYMFHEPNEVILSSKGFSDDDITKFRELNQKVQEVVEINKSRGGGKLVERVVSEFAEERPDRRDILTNLLTKIKDGEMYEPGDFQLSRYVEEIYLKTTGKYQFDEYCEERYRKLFLR